MKLGASNVALCRCIRTLALHISSVTCGWHLHMRIFLYHTDTTLCATWYSSPCSS